MNPPDLQPWLTLVRAPGIGTHTVLRLLEHFGSARAVIESAPGEWRAAGLDRAQIAALSAPDTAGVEQDLAWLAGEHRGLLTLDDPRYPPRLREIAQPPIALFCQGDAELLGMPQIGIVGARSATPQGLENAQAFAAELARRGLVVTSGLALGIDGAAHRGALEGGGLTVAVCGTGLDRVYPARHRALAHEIAAHGVLVSEFPIGVAALAENFPRRNRIISGLSLGTLVVEAARESGSLITARMASEQGREVFAIPGSIHNAMARGCHALIRQGAKLVETVDDILEELGPQIARQRAAPGAAPPPPAEPPALAPLQSRILELLGDETRSVDALAEGLAAPVAELQAALLELELGGHVASAPGGTYQRLRHAS